MKDSHDNQREVAAQIALRAGALAECEMHGEVLDNDSREEANKLGNMLFDTEFRGVFRSRREMTDLIKDVIDDAGWECGACDRNLND